MGRWIPGRPVLVEVEVLQRDRHDQVASAGQDAGALRAAQTLAAAEGDQVSAGVDEAAQIAGRRELTSGVDDNWRAVAPTQSSDFFGGRLAVGRGKVGDG